MNMLSDLGFLHSICKVLRVKMFGLLFGGIPCESYGFMSSGTHRRTAAEPFGTPYNFVVDGSTFASRFVVLAILAIARGVCWMVENPSRSMLPVMPCMQLLLAKVLHPLQVHWPLGCTKEESCTFVLQVVIIYLISRSRLELEPRYMGVYGGISEKPQLGLGNVS